MATKLAPRGKVVPQFPSSQSTFFILLVIDGLLAEPLVPQRPHGPVQDLGLVVRRHVFLVCLRERAHAVQRAQRVGGVVELLAGPALVGAGLVAPPVKDLGRKMFSFFIL